MMSPFQKVLFVLAAVMAFGLNAVVVFFALNAGPFMYAVVAGAFVAECVTAYLRRSWSVAVSATSSPYLAACGCKGLLPRKRRAARVPTQPRDVGTYTPERSPSPYEARIESDEKHDAPPLELREHGLSKLING